MRTLPYLILLLLLAACSPQPRSIRYGDDACHFCKMTVVDQQHAAQLVTAKGRVQIYDAIECLLHDLHQQKDQTNAPAFVLVADFEQSVELLAAQSATYLISKELPSPMGAFLAGFSSPSAAKARQQIHGGRVLSWEELPQALDLSQTP